MQEKDKLGKADNKTSLAAEIKEAFLNPEHPEHESLKEALINMQSLPIGEWQRLQIISNRIEAADIEAKDFMQFVKKSDDLASVAEHPPLSALAALALITKIPDMKTAQRIRTEKQKILAAEKKSTLEIAVMDFVSYYISEHASFPPTKAIINRLEKTFITTTKNPENYTASSLKRAIESVVPNMRADLRKKQIV